PKTGEVVVPLGVIVTKDMVAALDKIENAYVTEVEAAGGDEAAITEIQAKYTQHGFEIDDHGRLGAKVRSPITCELEVGICAKCYG
ncbi:hypothetical protein ABTN45_19930, partial [Acinetobacter baumannii]